MKKSSVEARGYNKLSLAYEAQTRGIPIHKLVDEKFRKANGCEELLQMTLRERIVNCRDRLRHWIDYYALEHEKDPLKRREIKIWMEITGVGRGGMAMSGSWASYKDRYFDNLPSEDDKKAARSTILSMLRSKKYDMSDKAIIAYVCADLKIKESLADINDLLRKSKDASDDKLYRLAYEALSKGISVHELVDEKFRKGERM